MLVPACRMLLWLALLCIFINATIPSDGKPFDLFNWDKLNHGFAFLVLGFLVNFSFPARLFGWFEAGLLIAYGVGIEVVQYFVPGRDPSLADIGADASGLLLFYLTLPWVSRLPVLRDMKPLTVAHRGVNL